LLFVSNLTTVWDQCLIGGIDALKENYAWKWKKGQTDRFYSMRDPIRGSDRKRSIEFYVFLDLIKKIRSSIEQKFGLGLEWAWARAHKPWLI